MYRIVQEALNNATKHGAARRAHVEVIEDDSTIRVTVRDDGRGFDPIARTDGFGLIGMRERVELLHGKLELYVVRRRAAPTINATFPSSYSKVATRYQRVAHSSRGGSTSPSADESTGFDRTRGETRVCCQVTCMIGS